MPASVISDRKLQDIHASWVPGNGAGQFVADVRSYTDYYAFGWEMPGRSEAGYQYGFNGKEKDGETTWNDFGARMYDARVGRWMAVDPKEAKYPGMTTYGFAGNSPIILLDHDGREIWDAQGNLVYISESNGGFTYYTLLQGQRVSIDPGTEECLNALAHGQPGREHILKLVNDQTKIYQIELSNEAPLNKGEGGTYSAAYGLTETRDGLGNPAYARSKAAETEGDPLLYSTHVVFKGAFRRTSTDLIADLKARPEDDFPLVKKFQMDGSLPNFGSIVLGGVKGKKVVLGQAFGQRDDDPGNPDYRAQRDHINGVKSMNLTAYIGSTLYHETELHGSQRKGMSAHKEFTPTESQFIKDNYPSESTAYEASKKP